MITCYFENGGEAHLRHVVAVVVVVKDDEVLLGKRSMKIPQGGKWGLPGGYLEHDESVIEGATREVLEETGWTIKDIKLLDVTDSLIRDDQNRQNICFTFYANADKQVADLDWETDEIKWFKLDDLPGKEEVAFDYLGTIVKYRELIQSGKPALPIFRS